MKRFLLIDSARDSNTSSMLDIDAAALLALLCLQKWEFRQCSALVASEICSKVVHSVGNSSMTVHFARICGRTEMWATSISNRQVETAVGRKPRSLGLLSLGKRKLRRRKEACYNTRGKAFWNNSQLQKKILCFILHIL